MRGVPLAFVRSNTIWRQFEIVTALILCAVASASAGVSISSPANGSSVTSPVHVVASATTYNYRINAMRVYVDYKSVYTVYSNKLDTSLAMASGSHLIVVQAWDSNGVVFKKSERITVGGATPGAIAVTVSPASASVQLGAAQQFNANVTGTTNTSVSWAVNGVVGGNNLVGTISTGGNYTAPSTMPSPANVTISATSAADTTKMGTATVAMTSPSPSPSTAKYYGSGLNADELANLRVGIDGTKTGLRFRAATSSSLKAVRLYVKTGSGYSGGTNGSWNIRVETDDNTANHFPSGNALASTTTGTLSGGFPLVSFASPASLNAGQIYHLVLTNADPNPSSNYASVNNLITFSMPNPMQPTMPDSDWMTSTYSGGWTNNKKTPVLELDYSNGASQGTAYIDAWASSRTTISGSYAARETFVVSGGDRAAQSISFRVLRSSGSSPLNFRLEQSNGTLIEQGTVPASSIGTSDTWATYTFSGVRTLASGQAYNIVLTTASDTTYTTEALQKGANYGFSSTTYFKDGHAELTTGSGWSGVRSRTDADYEFYFTTQ